MPPGLPLPTDRHRCWTSPLAPLPLRAVLVVLTWGLVASWIFPPLTPICRAELNAGTNLVGPNSGLEVFPPTPPVRQETQRTTAQPPTDLPVVGDIFIEGNHKTDSALILREIGLAVGDPFDENQLDLLWDHLEDVGYFAFVDMDFEEEEPGVVTLYITVEEDKTTRITPLIDYDRRHKYLLGATVQEINLRGRGEKVKVTASWYRVHRYRVAWERPWFLNLPPLSAGIGGGWERARFVFQPTKYTWWDTGGWLRCRLWRGLFLEGGLTFGGFEQRTRFFEVPPEDPSADQLRAWQAGWRQRLLPAVTLGWDDRDNPYYPTRGAYHRLRVQWTEGRGFADFTEWTADLRQFVPTPWGHTVALHAFGRRVNGPLPFENRLYWAGEESIRGYDYASLVGEEGYLLSWEYRWPLFLMPLSAEGQLIGIGLHLFTDAGDAWFEGQESGEALLSFGGGLHLNLSTFQFRFEFARTKDGNNAFQFMDTFNF